MNASRPAPRAAPAALATLAVLAVLAGLAAACAFRRTPPPGASGALIYDYQNCANCHGDAGEGQSLGPPLRDLGRHWTRDALGAFLADPDGHAERDPRLAELEERYAGNMQPYDNLTLEQRLVLADWLLGL